MHVNHFIRISIPRFILLTPIFASLYKFWKIFKLMFILKWEVQKHEEENVLYQKKISLTKQWQKNIGKI